MTRPATPRASDALKDAKLPTGERNRIIKAAQAMAEHREIAWITAPVVRACLSGRRFDEEFDLVQYALPEEMKGKKAKGVEEE